MLAKTSYLKILQKLKTSQTVVALLILFTINSLSIHSSRKKDRNNITRIKHGQLITTLNQRQNYPMNCEQFHWHSTRDASPSSITLNNFVTVSAT